MDCVNCEKEVTENFCPACGQRVNVKRITFKEGWNDFWSRVYGFDGMFPRTLRDLTIRPGHAAKKYIDGNRVSYYGPVGYFFLMITVFLLFMSMVNIEVQEFFAQKMFMKGEPGQQKMLQSILAFISDNIKIIAFIIIPFNALAARYIFFRKSGLNFIENLVLPFYVTGHIYWLNILSVLVYLISGSFFLNLIIAIITPLYCGFAYAGLMTYQSKTKSFLKGLFVPIMGQIFMTITMLIIIYLMILTIPDFYEFVRPSNNR